MARLRSSRRRRRERPPHRTARTVETANKADSTEPGRPKPAQERAQQQTRPRLPFGGWAWGPPGSGSARQRIRRARREKTYSVSRAWASTGVFDVTRALIGRQRADATRRQRWALPHMSRPDRRQQECDTPPRIFASIALGRDAVARAADVLSFPPFLNTDRGRDGEMTSPVSISVSSM